MTGADFRDADFYFARLSGAILDGSDFRGCKNLKTTNLGRVMLHNGREVPIRVTVSLKEANLSGVDLSYISLIGADLAKAHLQLVDFTGVSIEDVIFNAADLRGAKNLKHLQF